MEQDTTQQVAEQVTIETAATATADVAELLIEEISIDGMCGVY